MKFMEDYCKFKIKFKSSIKIYPNTKARCTKVIFVFPDVLVSEVDGGEEGVDDGKGVGDGLVDDVIGYKGRKEFGGVEKHV